METEMIALHGLAMSAASKYWNVAFWAEEFVEWFGASGLVDYEKGRQWRDLCSSLQTSSGDIAELYRQAAKEADKQIKEFKGKEFRPKSEWDIYFVNWAVDELDEAIHYTEALNDYLGSVSHEAIDQIKPYIAEALEKAISFKENHLPEILRVLDENNYIALTDREIETEDAADDENSGELKIELSLPNASPEDAERLQKQFESMDPKVQKMVSEIVSQSVNQQKELKPRKLQAGEKLKEGSFYSWAKKTGGKIEAPAIHVGKSMKFSPKEMNPQKVRMVLKGSAVKEEVKPKIQKKVFLPKPQDENQLIKVQFSSLMDFKRMELDFYLGSATGIVMPSGSPERTYLDGDYFNGDLVKLAQMQWSLNSPMINRDHVEADLAPHWEHEGFAIYENWIARANFDLNGEPVFTGDWLASCIAKTEEERLKMKNGYYNGYSIEGWLSYYPNEYLARG